MAAEEKPVAQPEIAQLIRVAVEKASLNGGMISATEMARAVLSKYPLIPVGLIELEEEIARTATHAGVGVEFGDPPEHKTDR